MGFRDGPARFPGPADFEPVLHPSSARVASITAAALPTSTAAAATTSATTAAAATTSLLTDATTSTPHHTRSLATVLLAALAVGVVVGSALVLRDLLAARTAAMTGRSILRSPLHYQGRSQRGGHAAVPLVGEEEGSSYVPL